MDNFKRSELKLLIKGLQAVRNEMRDVDSEFLELDEYNELVRLQDRLIEALESRFY